MANQGTSEASRVAVCPSVSESVSTGELGTQAWRTPRRSVSVSVGLCEFLFLYTIMTILDWQILSIRLVSFSNELWNNRFI